jgi:hypothetical protein
MIGQETQQRGQSQSLFPFSCCQLFPFVEQHSALRGKLHGLLKGGDENDLKLPSWQVRLSCVPTGHGRLHAPADLQRLRQVVAHLHTISAVRKIFVSFWVWSYFVLGANLGDPKLESRAHCSCLRSATAQSNSRWFRAWCTVQRDFERRQLHS